MGGKGGISAGKKKGETLVILETFVPRENAFKSVSGVIRIPNDVPCEFKYIKYVDIKEKMGRECSSSSYVIVV